VLPYDLNAVVQHLELPDLELLHEVDPCLVASGGELDALTDEEVKLLELLERYLFA